MCFAVSYAFTIEIGSTDHINYFQVMKNILNARKSLILLITSRKDVTPACRNMINK